MRTFIFISSLLIILSCKNDKQKTTAQETAVTKDTPVVANKPQPEQKIIKEEELAIVDTGQTWFRVKITKNDSAYMDSPV